MDYSHLIKKFTLPTGYKPPAKLIYEDLVARPLTKDDVEDDLIAVNDSIEVIRKTRGGLWPGGMLDKSFDFLDLAWHQREFRDNSSYAYVVYDTSDTYIGCFYLYPLGVRTTLNLERLSCDVDASWWVTTGAFGQGYYKKLHRALRQWLNNEFPFKEVYYSNKEIPT
jgi:hypothetical protein